MRDLGRGQRPEGESFVGCEGCKVEGGVRYEGGGEGGWSVKTDRWRERWACT